MLSPADPYQVAVTEPLLINELIDKDAMKGMEYDNSLYQMNSGNSTDIELDNARNEAKSH